MCGLRYYITPTILCYVFILLYCPCWYTSLNLWLALPELTWLVQSCTGLLTVESPTDPCYLPTLGPGCLWIRLIVSHLTVCPYSSLYFHYSRPSARVLIYSLIICIFLRAEESHRSSVTSTAHCHQIIMFECMPAHGFMCACVFMAIHTTIIWWVYICKGMLQIQGSTCRAGKFYL